MARDLFAEAGIQIEPPAAQAGPRDLFAEAGIKAPTRQPDSLARQLGLTARYGLEGMANTAQLLTEPIRYVTDRVSGQTGKTVPLGALATRAADWVGLPTPQTPGERIVGDAARTLAGSGGLLGGAQAAANLGTGAVARAGAALAQAPLSQLSSATGAGLAGGQAREAGASEGAQAVSALLGGVAGGAVPVLGRSLASGVKSVAGRTINKLSPQQLDARISQVLQGEGVNWGELSGGAQNALRRQMADALNTGREVDPVAVRRLADFASVPGATPTRGMVTQNPVLLTREQNLAKMAAASSDDALAGLPLMQNRNNTALIGGLNGVGPGGSPQGAGEALSRAIIGQRDALRGAERQAWDTAKGLPGYTQPLEKGVLSRMNAALDDEGLMPFMNKSISDYMGAFQHGERAFTPQDYRNLQSMLSREMSKGGNEAAAAGVAARVLGAADLKPINPVGHITTPVPLGVGAQLDGFLKQPGQAIDAVNQARAATKAAYGFEGSTPLVRSALSDAATADPQRLANRYILGGTLGEAREVARHVGQSPEVRGAILAHLKDKALGGASDEVGKFSQSAYNKALSAVGESKLGLFFSPEEVRQLNALGRVASYMQNQPAGSAVNNSNSGTLLSAKALDALNFIGNRIPMGRSLISDPLAQLRVDLQTRAAQNVVPGLLTKQPGVPMLPGLGLPALAVTGGLLSAAP